MAPTKSSRAIKLRNKILKQAKEMRESEFFKFDFDRALKKCLKTISNGEIQKIICYGLGSLDDSINTNPRDQLTFLILLHEQLCNLNLLVDTTIEMFDPRFNENDRDTLKAFENPRITILSDNEHCCRQLKDCSGYHLFYMPFVDFHLYNNLLGVNWNPEDLGKLIILGTSLREFSEYTYSRMGRSELSYFIRSLVSNCKLPEKTSDRLEKKRLTKEFAKRDKEEMEQVEEKMIDKENCCLLEYQVGKMYSNDAFSMLALHIVSKEWLNDSMNHVLIEKSRKSGWEPYIEDLGLERNLRYGSPVILSLK